MKRGHLSQYFAGVAAKHLSAVEADVARSHQHEFNGVEGLKRLLGEPTGKVKINGHFLYLDDSESDLVTADDQLTWYDARERHPTRSECRLYFPSNDVMRLAAERDLLVIARQHDGHLLVIVAEHGSTIERQIEWLFGLSDLVHPGFSVKGEIEGDKVRIEMAARFILEELGVEVEDRDESYLDIMLKRFGARFPKTAEFSAFARETLKDVSGKDNADAAITAWLEREEVLFRTLERHIVAEKLREGFGTDVDSFVAYSMSVHQRRKARAGFALENHAEHVFRQLGIKHARGQVTEGKSRPDFLFPGAMEYRDSSFSVARLSMLGAKATCKDRWRQVLAEADRITQKHLLTVEPGISENQTAEMQAKQLQLVVPAKLHETYTEAQQVWLMSFAEFCELVLQRQQ